MLRGPVKLALLTMAVVLAVSAQPAMAIKVCSYNILNFNTTSAGPRVDAFRTVMDEIDADLIVVQEIDNWLSQNGLETTRADR